MAFLQQNMRKKVITNKYGCIMLGNNRLKANLQAFLSDILVFILLAQPTLLCFVLK